MPGHAGAAASVLLVCQNGVVLPCPTGSFSTIQGAVNAAAPGDWILVAPGDYHEKTNGAAGVWIGPGKDGIHLRGWDRNATVVDGTLAAAPGSCSGDPQWQDDNAGKGRNGIEVYKATGTWIENLTVCNYLTGPGGGAGGNQVWWNGGDATGTTYAGNFWGNWLTATSTFYGNGSGPQPEYGIFDSNYVGPGSSINHTYAANMADSAYYVGACDPCNVVIDDGHAENSALGFSGTNSGGYTIQNTEFDNNKAGIVPNSLNNDDAPPPHDGRCVNPDGSKSATNQSCTFIVHNRVHDNNNPDVPGQGIASAAPIGAGIELAGASFNTVSDNQIWNQGGWGFVVHDYPDTETPPASGVSSCQGGVSLPGNVCFFHGQGNTITDNVFHDNGAFGNPTNGDIGNESASQSPRNCFSGNTDSGGSLSSDPPAIETVDGAPCDQPGVGDTGLLAAELVCASGAYTPCPTPASAYPQPSGHTSLAPLTAQVSMADPCAGVPDDAWCSGGQPVAPGAVVAETPGAPLIPAALLGAAGITLLTRRRQRRAPSGRTIE